MATVNFTIGDALFDRVKDAFDITYPGRTDAGDTKAQWVARILKRYCKDIVKAKEIEIATSNAANTTAAQVDTDFGAI